MANTIRSAYQTEGDNRSGATPNTAVVACGLIGFPTVPDNISKSSQLTVCKDGQDQNICACVAVTDWVYNLRKSDLLK